MSLIPENAAPKIYVRRELKESLLVCFLRKVPLVVPEVVGGFD
jgi:hypothetical protein